MKSIVVRCDEDLAKIDQDVKEIEFYEYNNFYDISDLELDGVSYTKMSVDFDFVPINVKSLSFFDCDFTNWKADKLKDLQYLEITNQNVDIFDLVICDNLMSINLNFCDISNEQGLIKMENLKCISLIGTNISNFEFLDRIDKLEKIIIDDKIYDENKNLFDGLSNKGVLVLDMMGGVFNDI